MRGPTTDNTEYSGGIEIIMPCDDYGVISKTEPKVVFPSPFVAP
jgi:hypothetical protein